MLEYVANAFNGNSNVAGFELINEPSPGGSTFFSTLLGSPYFDSQQLTPFYNQGADAIRAVDPTTPIFFEPNVLSNASLPTDLGTVNATNTVLSFHDYCEFDLGPLGCLPSVSAVVGNAEAYAQAHGIPAFMTEFGATSTQSQILAPLQGADLRLIGWTEWAYSGQGDITTSASPPDSESLVFNPELPPTGTNVNTANLETLAEPYPQLISGTPTSYFFENGTFDFSYSTAEADGMGSFPAGSETTIAVPSVEFPNGYDVAVTGGHVVSAPDAPELVIASDNGASTVSVVVSAATVGGAAAGKPCHAFTRAVVMTEPVAAFAERARTWLADSMPHIDPQNPPYADRGDETSWQHVRTLQRRLYDGGFAGICFPTEYGGLGLDIEYQKAFDAESVCYEMPLILNTPTFTICAATILDTGTEAQKRQHISAALRGDEVLVQLLSEPSGGSDLAGVITRAERRGDKWVVNGAKTWSTGAFAADYGLLLARTNWDVPKHDGLTMFLVPMHSPGITLRRIKQVNGSTEFCEEFFDDLELRDDAVVGEVGKG